jgi:hypothetical protein
MSGCLKFGRSPLESSAGKGRLGMIIVIIALIGLKEENS